MEDRIYTLPEAMKVLDCSRDTLYRWMNSGELDFFVLGARRRIRQSAIDDFIVRRTGEEKRRIAEKNEAPGLVATGAFAS